MYDKFEEIREKYPGVPSVLFYILAVQFSKCSVSFGGAYLSQMNCFNSDVPFFIHFGVLFWNAIYIHLL